MVRDLGSTNGTFVNGQRIEERQLKPGDRIQIGSAVITFCEVGGVESSCVGGDDKTVMMERPTDGNVFQGDLAEIPPYAVLQILELGRKTGELVIEGDTTGRLWLQRGDPIHAETKNQIGFDAAVALVNVTAGQFSFEPKLDTPQPTIEASVTQLLLEASRILDESSRT